MSPYITVVFVTVSLLCDHALAGQFSGAVWANGLTAASAAVCPANAPIGCSAIQQPDYCCPSGNYCAWASNQVVGCCPYGETCTGTIGGGGAEQTTWAQVPTTTTWAQPSTVYATTAVPTTTVYGGIVVPGVVSTQQVTTQYVQQTTLVQTTQQSLLYGAGYCSTLYADGPGLPTTRPGSCGTILVLNEATRPGSAVAPLIVLAMMVHLLL